MQSQIQNDIKTADNIGRQFLQAFFQQNADISNFYGNDSILSFESETYIGRDDIIGKLKTFNVSTIPTNYSVQPSNNGILIFCSGSFQLVGETNQMPFAEGGKRYLYYYLRHKKVELYLKQKELNGNDNSNGNDIREKEE